MNEYILEFITIAGLHLLAVMSPGPDFIMISRNSIVYSRRTGIFSALGLALGILLHVTYSLIGLGLIISKSIVLFGTIKFLGAGYLVYIGIKSLRSKKSNEAFDQSLIKNEDLTPLQSVKMGFLTNALNPKATLFFLAVFTQVIDLNTPLGIKVLYGLEMSLATFLWFAAVAIILSHTRIKQRFSKIQHYIEKTMGAMLIALGIKVALSHK